MLDLFPMTHHVEAVTRFVAGAAHDDSDVRAAKHWHTDAVLQPNVSDEVAKALSDGVAVVAMESTIFSNLGLPSPANAEALARCTAAIRDRGAIPALTAVLDGVARVGLDTTEHDRDPRTGAQGRRARSRRRGGATVGVRCDHRLGIGRAGRGRRASRCSRPAGSVACTEGPS